MCVFGPTGAIPSTQSVLCELAVRNVRDLEVVDLIAHGLNNPALATQIHIAVKTVINHRSNIAHNLQVLNSVGHCQIV